MLVPKTYKLLATSIDSGVRYGYRRAFKHVENPTEDALVDQIIESVLSEICEDFDIVDPEPRYTDRI